MIELAILGLLRREPLHGYELRRRVAELGLKRLSFGALYPALRRLERRQLIAPVGDVRQRKQYAITDDGIARCDELLTTAPEDDQALLLRIAFLGYLDRATRLEMLRRYRVRVGEQLDAAQNGMRLRRRLDRYSEALARRGVATARVDLEWLDGLIAEEAAAGRRTPAPAR